MISIIIATYNRPDLLYSCCESLAQQKGLEQSEVLIIDNFPENKLGRISQAFPDFQIIKEPQRGLSNARNRGVAQAKGDWLLFLDDDVLLDEDFLAHAYRLIKESQFTAIGGHYRPWHPVRKPNWLPKKFGEKIHLREDFGAIIPGQDGFLSGGVLLIATPALVKVGGFNPDLGMSSKLAYGEEDELQLRLHQAGFQLAYDPHWSLQHAVLPHKLKLSWHLKSAYARRRDNRQTPLSFGALLLGTIRSLVASLLKLLIKLYTLITRSDYYWQNLVLDIGIPLARRYGDWQAYWRR